VPLACHGAIGAACEGAVVLLSSRAKAGRPLKPKDVLATAPYRVAARDFVRVKLKQAERKILSRKRRLKARIVVRPSRGAAITRRVTLALPPKAKPRAARLKSR
jgi:hypothetical protein